METRYHNTERPTVLVTEARGETRLLAGRILQAHGFEVLYARNSLEALVTAFEHAGNLDCLITDCGLRGYHNGLELATCFHELWPKACIVIMGDTPTSQEARILREAAGGFAHIAAPRNPDEAMQLVAMVRSHCADLCHG